MQQQNFPVIMKFQRYENILDKEADWQRMTVIPTRWYDLVYPHLGTDIIFEWSKAMHQY